MSSGCTLVCQFISFHYFKQKKAASAGCLTLRIWLPLELVVENPIYVECCNCPTANTYSYSATVIHIYINKVVHIIQHSKISLLHLIVDSTPSNINISIHKKSRHNSRTQILAKSVQKRSFSHHHHHHQPSISRS